MTSLQYQFRFLFVAVIQQKQTKKVSIHDFPFIFIELIYGINIYIRIEQMTILRTCSVCRSVTAMKR